ncbi:MAG: GtrA family protein [Verrucomicrobiota bacterium]|jgi:putative flippase GtrA
MKAAIASFLRERRLFVVYCLIGLSGVTLDYACYYALVNWAGVYYLLANAVSCTLGISNNFFLNCFFNFKVKDRWLGRFVSFYCVGLLGLAVSSAMLYALVSLAHMNPNYSKLWTLGVVVVLQYNLNRLISFRK